MLLSHMDSKLKNVLHWPTNFTVENAHNYITLDNAYDLSSDKTKELINEYLSIKEKIEKTEVWAFYKENLNKNKTGSLLDHQKFEADSLYQIKFDLAIDLALKYGAEHSEEVKELFSLLSNLDQLLSDIEKSFKNDIMSK